MGTLSQLQSLLAISGGILGFLTTILGVIMTNRMFSMKEKIKGEVNAQFKEMKTEVNEQFKEMKKEMHDTMVTKEFFNGKFDLMNERMNSGLSGFREQLQQFISLQQRGIINGKGE